MGELREIVEMATVERWFAILAIVAPVVGAIVGAALGARKGQPKRGMTGGFLVGLLGTLNWLLWRLYNAITDANGLDTVKNVLINVVLFVAVGAVIGLTVGYVWRPRPSPPSEGEEPSLVGIGGPGLSRSPGAERRMEESDDPPRDP